MALRRLLQSDDREVLVLGTLVVVGGDFDGVESGKRAITTFIQISPSLVARGNNRCGLS